MSTARSWPTRQVRRGGSRPASTSGRAALSASLVLTAKAPWSSAHARTRSGTPSCERCSAKTIAAAAAPAASSRISSASAVLSEGTQAA
jgi:hypothetical protein